MPSKTKRRGLNRKSGATRPGGRAKSPARKTATARGFRRLAAKAPCPVVGIGASAGGLDALKQFFEATPPDIGAAFVLIQHLDPTHLSLTAELLGRNTSMSVVQVNRPMAVEPNHVYVIPPNRYLGIKNGKLRLTEPTERRGRRMPVDFFLRSLADDCGERAIGIILSGSGTDGTAGLKEVKAGGGITIVQDPETAEYDGMPRSAITSGSVDHVLPLSRMPVILSQYINHSYVRERTEETPPLEKTPGHLDAVIAILRERAKFDFGWYRKGTLTRRIRRRMGLRHIDQLAGYVRLLREDPDEATNLFKDLLINVTSFFREPRAWAALAEHAISPFVAEKGDSPVLRVWVPGCATGEEAYTVAMLLIEETQAARKACQVRLFASDVDTEALDFARAGVYPESIAGDVTPERLRRFFVKGDHTFRVSQKLRECVTFARQNVLADPPFSRLELICCRNLMIYLQPEVQRRLFYVMHFALNERGYMFLGPSESVSGHEDLFETVVKKWRIYRRIGPTRHDRVEFPARAPFEPRDHVETSVAPGRQAPGWLPVSAQRLLLERYAPASIIINPRYEILYFSGPTQDYLVQPTGVPTQDLLTLAREGLQTKLRAAVRKAVQERTPVTVSDLRVKRGKTFARVRLVVEPLRGPKELEGLLLVSFTDETKAPQPKSSAAPTPPETPIDEPLVRQLETELQATREDLESAIEELEASNEELKAANEEIMSANEELQSTNEELETSREELQSLNEELSTVNRQLEGKISEVETARNDLTNLLVSTELATLFLDRQLRIRRFTPAMTHLIRLIPSDEGRPISDLASPIVSGDLPEVARAVLEQLVPAESEIETTGRGWYLRRILPYRTEDNRIDGVVITFTDITARKHSEEEIRELNERLEQRVADGTMKLADATVQLGKARVRMDAIVQHAGEGIITVDEHGIIESFNPAAERMFGCGAAEVVGKSIRVLMPSPFAEQHEGYVAAYLNTGQSKMIGLGREVVGKRTDGSTFPMDLTVSEFHDGGERRFIGVVRDLTERKQRDVEMRELERTLADVEVREQRRIGRELHDHIGQTLSGSAMLARSLEQKLRMQPSPDADTARRLVEQLRAASDQTRELARGLAPVMTAEHGLGTALAALAENTQSIYNVPCTYEGDPLAGVANIDIAEHLFRIAQEAVSNAIRHANPNHVVISLLKEADNLVLTVRNDGLPLRTGNETQGIGLRIMRHRAQVIGAHLEIRAAEGVGTVVNCVIALPKA